MNVACPYCKAILTPKNLKPGRYKPNCPKCGKQFSLMVPEDEDGGISVQRIAVEAPKPLPLPKTDPVPMKRLPPGSIKDDEEEPQPSEEIAENEEEENQPLPKTIPMPIFRKPPKVLPDDSDETHAE